MVLALEVPIEVTTPTPVEQLGICLTRQLAPFLLAAFHYGNLTDAHLNHKQHSIHL